VPVLAHPRKSILRAPAKQQTLSAAHITQGVVKPPPPTATPGARHGAGSSAGRGRQTRGPVEHSGPSRVGGSLQGAVRAYSGSMLRASHARASVLWQNKEGAHPRRARLIVQCAPPPSALPEVLTWTATGDC